MGKQKSPRRVAENEALSVGGQIRGSAQKLNLVAGLIRGKKAEEALNILSFSPKAMARDVRKVLASAIANAENNHNLDVDSLVVAEASVGKSHLDEAVHAARPRPRQPHRQTVQPRAHRRPRAAGSVTMGQKSNPIGLRLQINRTWDSRWFAEGDDYGRLLLEDLRIRKFIIKELPQAAISKVVIERPAKLCRVSIYAARPGVIIGKKGADIEKLRKKLGEMTSSDVSLNIVEIRKPEIDSRLVAQGVADQLERRIAFRRAMKRAVQSALQARRRGHPDHLRRAPGRRRDRAHRMVSRGPGAAAHFARQRRLCRGDRAHRLRRLRRQGLDLQGRDIGPRSARPGPADDGGADFRRPSGALEELRNEKCCNPNAPSSARPTRAASMATPRAARR